MAAPKAPQRAESLIKFKDGFMDFKEGVGYNTAPFLLVMVEWRPTVKERLQPIQNG
jgi:hypothetical protein